MKWNRFGEHFRVVTFGESHGKAMGVVIDGVKPGLEFNIREIEEELKRRRPGSSIFSSPRKEPDSIEVISGVLDGKTLGTPICILVWNKDVRSEDYEPLKEIFRPGHGDYTYWVKYGIRDWRGGGRSSGRETVSRVIAGSIAKGLLKKAGVNLKGFVRQIGSVKAEKVDLKYIDQNPLRCPDPQIYPLMVKEIKKVVKERDSIGGIVELWIDGVPPGLGDPVFGKLDAMLGGAILSIGAVKGVEFGEGFSLAERRGSQSNDMMDKDYKFITNRAGGILGGISTGERIVVRASVKPTPSIGKKQSTVNIKGEPVTIEVKGRHDPCICPRVVPVVEAMAAIVILEAFLTQRAIKGEKVLQWDILGELLITFDNLLYYGLKGAYLSWKLLSSCIRSLV